MTKAAIVAALQRDNKGARLDHCSQYADAFRLYRTASANIEANGAIVLHPRTGAPIENPYLQVQERALATLRKFPRLSNTAALWTVGP